MGGNLAREIAREILRLRRQEQWDVGAPVPVQTLARRLGVSRTPVRKALLLLVDEGVLERQTGAGFKIGSRPVADPEGGSSDPTSLCEPEGSDLSSRILADRASNQIAPDVSESGLLARYGTSRGAVRKALQLLAAEGLVQRQRGHGWRFVESLDNEEAIAESYAFRISVECAALRQPGYQADARELAQLRNAHLEFLAKPAGAASPQEWFWINAHFHEALAAWSQNRFFLQAIRQQNSLRRMHQYADFPSLTPDEIEQSCRDHLGILEAIEAADLTRAERLLLDHLSAATKR
ncbi:MAG TPA: GntR family transcriptional regulator [Microvirga sp.]|jgi:DNA-binding GntR family transcriptional regulator|nr:GntR family transcriptional regulator [Microvirga sp.]